MTCHMYLQFGVTDSSGKLSLWQGIHTFTQSPYQMLTSGMKSLSDFLFLGSSSLIAACGDGNDNRYMYVCRCDCHIWGHGLMPYLIIL